MQSCNRDLGKPSGSELSSTIRRLLTLASILLHIAKNRSVAARVANISKLISTRSGIALPSARPETACCAASPISNPSRSKAWDSFFGKIANALTT